VSAPKLFGFTLGETRDRAAAHIIRHGWTENRGEVLAFARWLVSRDGGGYGDENGGAHLLLDYFEKPWHWTAEREEWVKRGRP
jgi:hypothetical protein